MGEPMERASAEQVTHYVPPRKRRGRARLKMQPPMTAMIDVTFLLLLFFVMTAKFRQDEGPLPGSLPRFGPVVVSQNAAPLPEAITIKITPTGGDARSGAVYECSPVSHLPIASPQELFEVIEQYKRQFKTAAEKIPLKIRAREDVRWEFVVEVWNVAQRARLKNVEFVYDAEM